MRNSKPLSTRAWWVVWIFTVLLAFQSHAQDDGADMEDVILMKTAEVLRGEIV